jgi:pimeloyl-ACP methyl ester carboxylesterase
VNSDRRWQNRHVQPTWQERQDNSRHQLPHSKLRLSIAISSRQETPAVNTTPAKSTWRRFWRGLICALSFLILPIGRHCRGRWIKRCEPERLDRGLVLILPGMEGRSFLNVSLLAGLVDAGLPCGMEIVDWTTGCWLLAIYHLRAWKRNRRVARQIADRVVEYRRQYPGRPVWLVGHSAGGAMALLTAEFLPAGEHLTGIVLLAPAISSRYSCEPALERTERGIWSFFSAGDVWFLGLGTLVFGTCDGVHRPASGCIGFAHRTGPNPAGERQLRQVPYRWRMIAQFNLGGHFGCVNRVFVAETVAPILRENAGYSGTSTYSLQSGQTST